MTKAKVGEKIVSQSIPVQVMGPRPGYLGNVNLGPIEQQEKGTAPRKSILAQYWYIILPLAIIVFFGGGPEENPTKKSESSSGAPTSSSSSSSSSATSN